MMRRESLRGLGDFVAKLIGGLLGPTDAENGEAVRQQAPARQIVKRRHQQPLHQIAAGAEDDDRARRRRFGAAGLFAGAPGSCLVLRVQEPLLGSPLRGSMWPPNPLRIAESSLSANAFCSRERKRA